jgi:hypothetical protein
MTEPTELSVVPPPLETGEGETVEEENDEFQERVNRLLELLAEDPSVRDRMIAEIYVTVAEFQAGFREMQENVSKMGPRAFFKSMFGKEKGGE